MPTTADAPAATVLVVDDNEDSRELAGNALELAGYRVLLASGGAEALAMFERERPACVVLDVQMPGMDGFAVCERIRAAAGGAEASVLFLTGMKNVETFDRAARVGADDFVSKPVRPLELVVRVKCALKVRRLDAELQEHFQLLKQQRDDLLRLQLEKARLTAFIVHDLKNPLNSIDLNAQLLLTDRDLTPLARDCGAHIRVEAKQLNRMILNLLDLAKSDEGRMHPFPLDLSLRAMVDEIVAEMEVPAKVRHVTLHSSIDTARAFADESLLRRTLANLVENAIRHAPPESVVDITAQRAAHSTELRVIDAGPGVPREMRDRVFDAFTQVDRNSGHSERSSRGLGLTFCKVAMEAHGGRIWVEDSAIGATFCVSLPDGG